jgi:tetratricopeptide (TPR) repeat protein
MPLLPFLLAGLAISLITVFLEITHLRARGAAFAIPIAGRCIIAGKVFWFYLAKIFWPSGLCATYPRWNPGIGSIGQFAYPLAALLCGAGLWMIRRQRPEFLTCYIYYAAMLTPVMGFVNIACFRYTFVADRWQHLACIGPIVLASSGLAVLSASRRIPLRRPVQAFSVAVVLILGIMTFRQAGVYKSGEAFYRGIVTRNPSCGMAYNNLGVELLQRGAPGEAAVAFQRAIDNNYEDAYFNFSIQYYFDNGRRLIRSGNRDEAIALFKKAAQFYPGNTQVYEILGSLYSLAGDPGAAIDNYRRAVSIAPANGAYRQSLGIVLMQTGRFSEAVDQFNAAVAAGQGNPYCLANLAEAYFRLGNRAEAVQVAMRGFELARRVGDGKIAAELHRQVGIYK